MQVNVKALRGQGLRIAAVLLVLLVLAFGVLQYQWIAKVGELDRERQMQGLRSSLTHFAEDFDGELSGIQLRFQVSASSALQEGDDGLAGHYDAWRRQAKFPDVIQEIWVVVAEGDDRHAAFDKPEKLDRLDRPVKRSWTVRRFDPTTRRLLPDSLPQHLAVQRDDAAASMGLVPVTAPAESLVREPTWLDEGSMTLMAPLFSSRTVARKMGREEPAAMTIRSQAGFAFIVLDRSRILKGVLPALARKHFGLGTSGSDDGAAYDIAVRRNTEAGEIVFSTFSDLEEERHAPDASVPLLQIRPQAFGFQPVMLGGLAGPAGTALPVQATDAISIVRAGVAVEAGADSAEPVTPPWRLTALHRAGSLESFVDGTWRRNLAISAGVLLLLLTAAAAAVLAWQRSSALRQQQLEFVAGISHELRTPVSVVCLSAANLADGVIDEPAKVRQYGQVLLREGRRLAEMTEQVLAFARIESNVSAERAPFPIAKVTQSALDSYEALMHEWKFSCVFLGDNQTCLVKGDAVAVERAIQNVLSNALKYSDAVRQIRVSIVTRDDETGSWVGVSVQDQGAGIPAAELDQVLLPFQRGRQAIEQNIPGTGIGLSLVKRVAEGHGGRVEIQSTVGRGTQVTIWLPEYLGDTV